MIPLTFNRALVVGDVEAAVRSASELLRRRGVAVTERAAATLDAGALEGLGPADRVVVCGLGVGKAAEACAAAAARGVMVIGERELAFQQSYCLHVAVTGACGKRSTAEMIAHLLRATGRRVEVAAWPDRPACGWVEETRDLDFLVHAVEPEEMATFQFFRPVVAVLLNAPERDDAEVGESGIRRYMGLFAKQQPFDWAIVEARAMARMEAASLRLAGKRITFSAMGRQADLGFERGLLVSRLEGWAGPLWDMQRGGLRGGHFAENAMATLAVGRVLRVGLDEMTSAMADFVAPPGRFEWLGEVGGVGFVNDGQAGHLEALDRALTALAPTPPESPFIWLIAGGDRASRHVYDLGPVLSARVRHVFLLGEGAGAFQAAWQLFTPCTPVSSLLDAANRAVEQAAPGDVILYSPGCPSRGMPCESGTGTDEFRDVFRTRLRHAGGSEGLPLPGAQGPVSSPGRVFDGVPPSNFSRQGVRHPAAEATSHSRESSTSHRS